MRAMKGDIIAFASQSGTAIAQCLKDSEHGGNLLRVFPGFHEISEAEKRDWSREEELFVAWSLTALPIRQGTAKILGRQDVPAKDYERINYPYMNDVALLWHVSTGNADDVDEEGNILDGEDGPLPVQFEGGPVSEPVEPEEDVEHSVLVSIDLHEFGATKDREEIWRLEEELESLAESGMPGQFDGNEIGGGVWKLFFYGPDAEALFACIETTLRRSPLAKHMTVTKRYGTPGDPSVKVETLRL